MSQAGTPPGEDIDRKALTSSDGEVRTYHGHQVIKTPAWTWEVPWYLFCGGLAGASSTLAAVARANGNDSLARAALFASAPAAAASPVLLVMDLGVPKRFLNMLRVFKPTSPMSMGAWLLAVYAPLSIGTAACEALGIFPGLKRLLGAGAAVLGPPLATYTAVLVSNSVVPVWNEARHDLPLVFGASAAASAGAAATMLTPPADATPARRLLVGASVAEIAAVQVMERRLGEIGEPYSEGVAGHLNDAAVGLTGAGAALVAVLGRRSRVAALAGSAMVLAGSACERWAVYKAGFASSGDPKYVVGPQRARLQRGESAGAVPSDSGARN